MIASSAPTRVGSGAMTCDTIPAHAGIGLRAQHFRAVLEQQPAIAWLEVHPENYFGGGRSVHYLEQIRAHYPLSMHGVGLSLGSVDPLDATHLDKLKDLLQRFEPALFSEHISWGSVHGRFLNDLLPMPYTEEALDHICQRVEQVQDYLGRQMLVENVSSYLEFKDSDIPEWEFVAQVAKRSGCGILLDVNNIYVNARNHGFDAQIYLNQTPLDAVQEIHLAGFSVQAVQGGQILIDTHSQPVCDDVWDLYRRAIERLGPIPTLIEWDTDIPELSVLLDQAAQAELVLEAQHALVA